MSYRLNRAIGYGLTLDKLENSTNFSEKGHDLVHKIQDIFETWDKPLVIPKEEISYGIRDVLTTGKCSDLIIPMSTPDDVLGVLFMPYANTKNHWYEYDPDIAYSFERWRNGLTRNDVGEPRDFLHEVPYGHFPYTNSLMYLDGTDRVWDSWDIIKDLDDVVPKVPPSISFYLQEMGIFSKTGVLNIRPYIAQWWS